MSWRGWRPRSTSRACTPWRRGTRPVSSEACAGWVTGAGAAAGGSTNAQRRQDEAAAAGMVVFGLRYLGIGFKRK